MNGRIEDEPVPEVVRCGPNNLMLDSGAFSVWNTGDVLDIEEYIEFCHEYGHLFETIVSLDAIPGKPAAPSDRQQKYQKDPEKLKKALARWNNMPELSHEDAAEQSFRNWIRMKEAGIDAMPVFHRGEDSGLLQRYLDAGADYIGIGGIAVDKTKGNFNIVKGAGFLQEVFTELCNRDGYPIVKTHGFGITKISTIRKYPWYSVDSTSFMKAPSFGVIYVPHYPDARRGDPGKPDYGDPRGPVVFHITGQTTAVKKLTHETSPEIFQDCVRHFVEEEVGVTMAQVRYYVGIRAHAVAYYYRRMFENMPYHRFDEHRPLHCRIGRAVKWDHKRVYFAIGDLGKRHYSHALNAAGGKDRLLSYSLLRHQVTMEKLERYKAYGNHIDFVKKPARKSGQSSTYWNYRSVQLSKRVEGSDAEADNSET